MKHPLPIAATEAIAHRLLSHGKCLWVNAYQRGTDRFFGHPYARRQSCIHMAEGAKTERSPATVLYRIKITPKVAPC